MNSNRKNTPLYNLFWKPEWAIPNSGGLTLTGHSKAAEKTGFRIPELALFFDAGVQCYQDPEVIAITHAHTDHSFALPMLLTGIHKTPLVMVPVGCGQFFDNFVRSTFELSVCSTDAIHTKELFTLKEVAPTEVVEMQLKGRRFNLEIFRCEHTVPSVGYGLCEMRPKLKAEYSSLDGPALGALRKTGVAVTEPQPHRIICFLGDTHHSALLAAGLRVDATAPKVGLSLYPVIVVECSYFLKENSDSAESAKHIHWDALLPFVLANPEITFVLIHFSLRYSDTEIAEFFKAACAEHHITNIVVWLDEAPLVFH
ncbi:beta-lactamase superfamily domain [Pelomyxa schiedti]|nr:beta-lactamase superfamily domain [Pelomyxa schiedti]